MKFNRMATFYIKQQQDGGKSSLFLNTLFSIDSPPQMKVFWFISNYLQSSTIIDKEITFSTVVDFIG